MNTRAIPGALLLLFLLPGRLGEPPAQAPAGGPLTPDDGDDTRGSAPFEALRHALAAGSAPETIEQALSAIPPGSWDLRGRLLLAERAYRQARPEEACPLLRSRSSDPPGYLSAYASYLGGLLACQSDQPGEEPPFARTRRMAGNTMLGHRAGLWLVESKRAGGDLEGALALLDELASEKLEDALGADLAVRRAETLRILGREPEAVELLSALYLDQPLLGYNTETVLLFRSVRETLEGRLEKLPPGLLARRIAALLDAGIRSGAETEAKLLARVAGADPEAHLVLARVYLSTGKLAEGLRAIQRVPATSPLRHQARLLEARLLLARQRRAEADKTLVALAEDGEAGQVRFQAAQHLAELLEASDAPRAQRYRELIARECAPGSLRDEMLWGLAWSHYGKGHYGKAAAWLAPLAESGAEASSRARGSYWLARCLERAGRTEEAVERLGDLARAEPASYHGLRARERLEMLARSEPGARRLLDEVGTRPPAGPDDPLTSAPPDLQEALRPARELLLLGLLDDARAEIRYQQIRFPDSPAPALLLAVAYHKAGDYLRSVRWLKKALPDVERTGIPTAYLSYLYPLAHWDLINKYAREHGIDPYLAAAVIYQESRFQTEARSRAGALGLMQILPSTAVGIARTLREPPTRSEGLFDPDRNIRYGVHYLRGLLDMVGGDTALALAGYNAGPGRVKRWAAGGVGDIAQFVEEIPFRETRNYVKSILAAQQGYRRTYDSELERPVRD